MEKQQQKEQLNSELKEENIMLQRKLQDRLVKKLKENTCCLLYTSDAADEARSVDLGGRRIIKKKKK